MQDRRELGDRPTGEAPAAAAQPEMNALGPESSHDGAEQPPALDSSQRPSGDPSAGPAAPETGALSAGDALRDRLRGGFGRVRSSALQPRVSALFCNICYAEGAEVEDPVAAPCAVGHKYCRQCLGNWVVSSANLTCPMCCAGDDADADVSLGPVARFLIELVRSLKPSPARWKWMKKLFIKMVKSGDTGKVLELGALRQQRLQR